MENADRRVCSVEHAGALDTNLRKLVHNPKRILWPYLGTGMTALDMGCGPGFFTLEMAKIVGKTGKVIAADIQEGMLDKLRKKISGSGFEGMICPYKCPDDRIGLNEKVDFVLMFWMLHESADPAGLIKEVKSILNKYGRILLCEPFFHVSKKDFRKSLDMFKNSGFLFVDEPKVFLCRSALLEA